jgi:hypothetical protein
MDIQNSLKNLIEFVKIFDKCQVRYWLDGGSLLGIIRDGKLMEYDVDCDIGVDFETFYNQRTIIFKEMKKLYWTPKENETNEHRQKFIKGFNKIDTFLFKKYKNLYWHRAFGGVFYWQEDLLNTLDTCTINNYDFCVPHNPKLFLEKLYGQNWTKPIKNMPKPAGYANYIRCKKDDLIMQQTLDAVILKGLV